MTEATEKMNVRFTFCMMVEGKLRTARSEGEVLVETADRLIKNGLACAVDSDVAVADPEQVQEPVVDETDTTVETDETA